MEVQLLRGAGPGYLREIPKGFMVRGVSYGCRDALNRAGSASVRVTHNLGLPAPWAVPLDPNPA